MLTPLALLYDSVSRLNGWMTTPMPSPVPVLCVGNVVAGGAGKTPTAISLARELSARGVAVHFLTRGYGGRLSGPLLVDLARHTAADVGDEALLLARVAPTWIGADRRITAQRAAETGAALVIMDDGFQNPNLRKDLSLLVIDGAVGLGNGRVIPAGPLREDPARALARANAVLIMGEDTCGIAARISSLAPRGLPLLAARLEPDASAAKLAGKRIFAFAGIARPEKFFASLRAAGCEIVGTRAFPDHHPFRTSELAALGDAARAAGATLVTTEKDRVRMSDEQAAAIEVFAVHAAWRDSGALADVLAPIEAKAAHGKI